MRLYYKELTGLDDCISVDSSRVDLLAGLQPGEGGMQPEGSMQ